MRDYRGKPVDAVEVQTVAEFQEVGESSFYEVLSGPDAYSDARVDMTFVRVLYSVYAHRPEGGVECIADCVTREDAQLVARSLAHFWNLPINDYSFEAE